MPKNLFQLFDSLRCLGSERRLKISTKTRYGLRLMIDVAQNQGDGCVALKDIAHRQDISKKYLEQVVNPLVSAHLLMVTRGPQGGYRLARRPEEITLDEIVSASEDGLELLACTADAKCCQRAEDCVSRRVWGGLQESINTFLSGQTLAEIL